MIKEPVGGPAAFYKRSMEQHGVYVAPGHWFDLEDVYFRVGFGWPTIDELKYGLGTISVLCVDKAR
ncbi:hypothetical protein N7471_003168 [Penicillium samsonianum]|uniref:uncharacterized protein n=1 Tax=Penicillium samsonianum TaxID=1882272 RepID=UPI0025472DE4|nr:uncharacterized protein N7471_003168 [Penicillium samsonianum]KAJ6143715.1 hypothetical protein N7471_003168 [Penicillium samsonianum]